MTAGKGPSGHGGAPSGEQDPSWVLHPTQLGEFSRDSRESEKGEVSTHDNTFEEGSVTSSTVSSEESFEYHEHNKWNPMLASLCHFEVGVVLEALLDEVDMGRTALACHFSLDCAIRHLPYLC